eukprot:1344123-Lingulodinium_polyedra.AAC.1
MAAVVELADSGDGRELVGAVRFELERGAMGPGARTGHQRSGQGPVSLMGRPATGDILEAVLESIAVLGSGHRGSSPPARQ